MHFSFNGLLPINRPSEKNRIFKPGMNLFRTISYFALAFLVLVSSSSFMVGMHFCKGEIKHLALFTMAEGCEKEKELPPCHKHLAAPCCDDESLLHEGEGFKASTSDISIAMSVIDMDAPAIIVAEIIPGTPAKKAPFYNYDPPIRSVDLTVTHRAFLI
jgi:hypothetical protein